MSFVLVGMVCLKVAGTAAPVCSRPSLWGNFPTKESCGVMMASLDDAVRPIENEDAKFACVEEMAIQ